MLYYEKIGNRKSSFRTTTKNKKLILGVKKKFWFTKLLNTFNPIRHIKIKNLEFKGVIVTSFINMTLIIVWFRPQLFHFKYNSRQFCTIGYWSLPSSLWPIFDNTISQVLKTYIFHIFDIFPYKGVL